MCLSSFLILMTQHLASALLPTANGHALLDASLDSHLIPHRDRLTYCDQLAAKGGHPTGSCTHAVTTWVLPRIFLISLKLYVPLYLAWSAFKLRWPHIHVLESIIRSSTFLALYTCTQYLTVMLFTSTISPTITRTQHSSFAWLSGLFTLLERKERRPELATYCMAHAINAIYQRLKKDGYFTHTPKPISYFILILSSAILTHFHRQHAPFVRTIFGFAEHDDEANDEAEPKAQPQASL